MVTLARICFALAWTAVHAHAAIIGGRMIASCHADSIDYDGTTVIEIETEADGDEFGFLTLAVQSVDDGFDNPSMTIDWGDGTVETLDSFVLVGDVISYYANASNTKVHTYPSKGCYTVLVSGNVSGVTPLTTGRSWYYIKSYSAKHSNIKKHTSVTPCSSAASLWRRPVGLGVVDFSRVHGPDGYGAPSVNFYGSSSAPFTAGPVEYRIPKVEYLTSTFCSYNTRLERLVVGNTMDEIFQLPASPTGSTRWDFSGGNLQHQVVIQCSDGEIRYDNGSWTRFPQ